MNDEQDRIWKEAIMLHSTHPPIIYWIGLRKTTISSGYLMLLLRFQ